MVAQVHGRRVVVIRDTASVPLYTTEADALISVAPRVAVKPQVVLAPAASAPL